MVDIKERYPYTVCAKKRFLSNLGSRCRDVLMQKNRNYKL